ncbi:hypothetical protein NliqN6_0075 [Naganishia liquefaciens]|uniref:Proteasome activator PA28 C-terminal domain-containing protein n=1 Tax=Naganishia liquefaciens TaxID=104408 RepID=A0A8H3TMV3_9TREE|nr:hypothetical protein NliqN6_0075 [Naganishia liquefaciens]
MIQDCSPASIKSLKSSMSEYHARLSVDAEKAIFVNVPSKILDLSTLIDSFEDPDSAFTHRHPAFVCDFGITSLPPDIPTEGFFKYDRKASTSSHGSPANTSVNPVPSLTDASHDAGALGGSHEDDKPIRTGLPTNPIFELVGKQMEREGAEIVRACMQMRRWMAIVTPQVEEGNNTGVEIQELAMSYLNSLQNIAANCVDYLATTRQNRGGMVRLYLRSPGIEDRMLALYECDKRELTTARQLLNLLHSKCLETVNVFQKNWGKICEPKGRRDVRWD